MRASLALVILLGACDSESSNGVLPGGDGGITPSGNTVGACDGFALGDGVESRVCVELRSTSTDPAAAKSNAETECATRYQGKLRADGRCTAPSIATCTRANDTVFHLEPRGGSEARWRGTCVETNKGTWATTSPWPKSDPAPSKATFTRVSGPPIQPIAAHLAGQAGMIVGATGKAVATTDGGATYRAVTYSSDRNLLGVFVLDATHAWILEPGAASDPGRVRATSDGGATWTSADVNALGVGIAFGDTLHGAVVGSSGALHVTSDGGKSWSQRSAGTSLSLSAVAARGARAWVVGEGGIVRVSTDGTSFEPKPSGTMSNLAAVHAVDDQIVFAAGVSGTVIKSVDGGQTFTPQSTGVLTRLDRIGFADGNDGWIGGRTTGTDGILLHTKDGGAKWSPVVLPEKGVAVLDIHATAPGSAVITVAGSFSDGYWSVLATTDDGATWTKKSFGATTLSGSFVDATHGFLAAASGLLTTDDGVTFWHRGFVDGDAIRTVHFADALRGWAGGSKGIVHRTEDGGKTWKPGVTKTTDAALALRMFGERGWMVTDKGVSTTVDGGVTWTRIKTRSEPIIGAHAFTADVIHLFDARGGVEISSNGGATWTMSGSSVVRERRVGAAAYADERTGLMIGLVDLALLTTDGASWHRTAIPKEMQGASSLAFADAKVGLATHANGGLFLTRDGAATWVKASDEGAQRTVFVSPKEAWLLGPTLLHTTNLGD